MRPLSRRQLSLAGRALPLAVVGAVAAAALVHAPSADDASSSSGTLDATPEPATLRQLDVPLVDAPTAGAPGAPDAAEQSPDASEGGADAPAGDRVVAELPRTDTKSFSLVGVTWEKGAQDYDVQVSVRTDGAWGTYQDLEFEPGDPDNETGRPGTEPLWTGAADGVAVKVSSASGVKPTGLRVATVDPGRDTAVTPMAATVGQPKIISRSSWGAGPGTSCSSPIYGSSMLGAVLHHTAGSNSYTASQSAGIVRATQSYHVGGRGWCDLGYNFLVDKYGQIFEGRKGGIDKMVRAAHSGNGPVNERTIGVSMMGNYDATEPSAALKKSVADLIAWRFSLAKLPATGTYSIGGVTLNRIAGHRNVLATACPGARGYAWLTASNGLRTEVANRLKNGTTTPTPSPAPTTEIGKLAQKIGSAALGKLVRAEWGNSEKRRAIYENMDLLWEKSSGAHAVAGAVKKEFYRTGEHNGSLGFPTSDVVSAGASGVTVQRFQKGAVYVVGSGSSAVGYALYGPLYDEYRDQDEATGALGTPRSAVYTARTGYTRAKFTKGYLEYSAVSDEVTSWYVGGRGPDSYTVPSTGKVVLRGHGFGHGIGMSQYGAEGAARLGNSYSRILSGYYPGTTLSTYTGNIRVLIGAATSPVVTVEARAGQRFRYVSSDKVITLPSSASSRTIERWRVIPLVADPTKSVLQYRVGSTWVTYDRNFWTGDAQFEMVGGKVGLVLPDGTVKEYRSIVRSAVPSKGSTTRKTVNVTNIDNYTLGVVAAEMPSSWQPEALKAQSVAARTYGVRSLRPSSYYDACDSTSCQVYKGVSGQTASTDAAVIATRGTILTYGGKPALTQYSSSTGGARAPGSEPYLRGGPDVWDGWSGNSNRDWTVTLDAATIQKAYPAVGSLTSLSVLERDMYGDWAGRVESIRLTGSKGSVTVTGPQFRFALGLRSHYFRLG